MTVNTSVLHATSGQPEADALPAARSADADVAGQCTPGTCVCRQRLADAIADVPPRRHELDVLRMYMGKPCE